MFSSIRKTWAVSFVLSITMSSMSLQAAPTITSVDTSQLSQGIITITGSGFGGAPQIEVYDDFEHSGAQHGAAIDANQAIVGQWAPISSIPPTYDNISLSGNFSFDAWNDGATRPGRVTHWFQNPVQSVYLSYWVMIPSGYPFPGTDASYLNYFSSDSSWKFTWLIDQDYHGNSSDVCVPTYSGRGVLGVGGNDGQIESLPRVENLWSKGNWIRISTWMHADPNSPTTNGHFRMQFWSAEHGLFEIDRQKPVFDADGPTTKQYQYINIPGWIRDFPGNNGRPLYDDIYISSGLNAYARVELTDASDYTKSTRFTIQKPISWTNTRISFQVVQGSFADVNNAVVHVFNGAGEATAVGSTIQGGSSSSASATPAPPLAPILQASASTP